MLGNIRWIQCVHRKSHQFFEFCLIHEVNTTWCNINTKSSRSSIHARTSTLRDNIEKSFRFNYSKSSTEWRLKENMPWKIHLSYPFIFCGSYFFISFAIFIYHIKIWAFFLHFPRHKYADEKMDSTSRVFFILGFQRLRYVCVFLYKLLKVFSAYFLTFYNVR